MSMFLSNKVNLIRVWFVIGYYEFFLRKNIWVLLLKNYFVI
jgi:hypothetical protein